MKVLIVIVAVGLASVAAAGGFGRAAYASGGGGSAVIFCPSYKPYVRIDAFGRAHCSNCFEVCEPAPEPDPLATELRSGESLYLLATTSSGATFDYAVWEGSQQLECAASTLPIGTSEVTCTRSDSTMRTLSVVVDGSPPLVDCTVPTQSVWYGADVTVACTAGDDSSGLANATDAGFALFTDVQVGNETDAALTGSRNVCDKVGNCTAVGPYSFKVDEKGPSVVCGVTPTFLLNQADATVEASVSDGGSGPASESVSAAADTTSVGGDAASATGADAVGNTTMIACPYQVDYRFGGFQGPVNGPPTVNSGRAGRTYPVKWTLGDANSNSIDALGAVRGLTAQESSCAAFAGVPIDPLEATATGSTSLRYDSTSNQYVYNWATPRPGCYTLFLELSSGQVLSAYFELS